MTKERRNPPAYTPVSSPEERYFASMAPDVLRAQVDATNQETSSDTMIDHIQDSNRTDTPDEERRAHPVDRKTR
jgi:hypothetical protein